MPQTKLAPRRAAPLFVAATLLFLLVSLVPLAPPSLAQSLPVFTGKGSVTEALNTAVGGIFDIGSGITMTFPKGLPVGPSRVVTLKKAATKPKPSEVAEGFSPIGLAVDFSAALAAKSDPMEIALKLKSDPRKGPQRAVLAMEIGTFCSEEHTVKLKNGLCSGWELIDAEYDSQSKQLVAKLGNTGGLRMVFGTLPK
jgi:hypothetical protein